MRIAGYEKVSVQDYPDHVSCIIFTQGCNMRCPYCQNSTLIPIDSNANLIDEDEIFEYIERRKNLIDGVTISGGEPTLQRNLKDFIKKVKQISGLDIKLDTNGTNYQLLKELIDEGLVDYVAMDIKNSMEKYGVTSGISSINKDNILKSIELLKQGSIDYEFRTTIIAEHHDLQDIYEIIKLVDGSKYYLQNFKMSENVIDKNLTGYSDEKLKLWNEILKDYKNLFIRGIEK